MIKCTKCQLYKSESAYGDRIEKDNGKRSECLQCAEKGSAKWREMNQSRVKSNKRVQYLRKRDIQTREVATDCEICRMPFDRAIAIGAKNANAPHWDHNHGTEAFRGWLCHNCNVMLGHAGDNPELLERATNYLRTKGCTPTRILNVKK